MAPPDFAGYDTVGFGAYGAGGAGVSLFGLGNSIWNDGTIQGGDAGGANANGGDGIEILADSVVDDITNLGLLLGGAGAGINGVAGYGIHNYGGTLTKLTNAQGGTSGGGTVAGLTYSGDLPELYDIFLTSAASYGELNVTDGQGRDVMTVGVSDLSVDLSTHVYSNVIKGVSADQMTNEEDAFVIVNGVLGVITAAGDEVWDLRVWSFAGDIAEPQHYILERQAANQRNALRYDCNMFAVTGSCVTGTLRQVSAGDAFGTSGGTPQLVGTVATAIRLDPTLRIGGLLEFGGAPQAASGVTFTSDLPMIGAFIGYGGAADGTGFAARFAATYQSQTATITRTDPLSDEGLASGSTSFSALGVTAEVSFGQGFGEGTMLRPYLGLVATHSTRAGYTESDTFAPLTFGDFTERQFTGTAGWRVTGSLAPTITYRIGAGVERDISHTLSGFDVSSTGFDASYHSPYAAKDTRLSGQLGLSYLLAPNQEVTIDGQVNQFGEDATDYGVSVGFKMGY
jgi:hypothetical protein